MQQQFDIPREPPEKADIEYYKSLARAAEERARDIRRIAALERARLEERLLEQKPMLDTYVREIERLRESREKLKNSSERLKGDFQRLKSELALAKAQIRTLKRAQDRIAQSRAHRLAEAYVRTVHGHPRLARALGLLRSVVAGLRQSRGA